MRVTVCVLLMVYAGLYVAVVAQVWALSRLFGTSSWRWLAAAFSIGLVSVLWVSIEAMVRLATAETTATPVTWTVVLRLGRVFGLGYASLACFLVAFHRLHRALRALGRIF